MITFPNAKINLGLNILKKRDDGFHEIETIMWPLKLTDALEIIPAHDGVSRFTMSGNSLTCDGKPNLCQRAWQLMQQNTGIGPVHMHLHKTIPAGSGLGGGSADAAFTLKMLNSLFHCNLSIPELKTLAAAIGSDCPFFIENTPSIATGRGEVLEPIGLQLSGLHLLLVVPRVPVNTAQAYSNVSPEMPIVPLLSAVQLPLEEWKSLVFNKFEDSVFVQHPLLKEMKHNLYAHGAVYVSMSGSGSAIFGLFADAVSIDTQEAFPGCFIWQEKLS